MFLTAIVGAVVFYGCVMGFFYIVQRAMLFPAPSGYLSPAEAGVPSLQEVPLQTFDGETVMVWERRAGPDRSVVLYFHGNGDNISSLGPVADVFADYGWGAVLVSYRGYPGSTGRPSEAALVADGLAVFDRLVASGVDPEKIILSGYSLGTAVAVAIAAARPAQGLFLTGAFAAADEVAKQRYPFLPVRTLMRDPFRSIDLIADVDMPVFLVHGAHDQVIDLAQAERLYAGAREPKHMLVLPDADHFPPVGSGVPEFLELLAGRKAPERSDRSSFP